MKTINLKKRRKQVGYLIKREETDSWLQAQAKKYGMVVKSFPVYFHPKGTHAVPPPSVRMGWEHFSECHRNLQYHVNLDKQLGQPGRFEYKVVKVTVIEEDV